MPSPPAESDDDFAVPDRLGRCPAAELRALRREVLRKRRRLGWSVWPVGVLAGCIQLVACALMLFVALAPYVAAFQIFGDGFWALSVGTAGFLFFLWVAKHVRDFPKPRVCGAAWYLETRRRMEELAAISRLIERELYLRKLGLSEAERSIAVHIESDTP